MADPENRYAFPETAAEHPPVREPSQSLLPAVGAGLAAAIAGGVLWGLIIKFSDYEIGIVAWAIGFLTDTAVVYATRGAKGQQLQVIAVVADLLGILLGKYLSFAFIIQEEAESLGGSIGLVSSDMITLFRENLGDIFGLFDLLWIALAVYTAWKIPRIELEEPTAAAPPVP